MSEITALGVPAIFVPSPYVANNHQYKNAMDLVEHNAGIMLEEKDLDGKVLIELIDKTLNDKDKLEEMIEGINVILVDERLTTVVAENQLLFADVSRKKRKQVIDKMAAVAILQGYLDRG